MLNYSANGPSGYNLTNSLRFRSSASAYLSRTPASAGNRQIWTWSCWVKKTPLASGVQAMIAAGVNTTVYDDFCFENDQIRFVFNNGTYDVRTTQVFRDPSAWYHIIVAVDTTQATASNRVKIYVNGSQVTAFATANYPIQNHNTNINNNILNNIGNLFNGSFSSYFDGYMDEINFIDGQALTPSSFGSTNPVTGVWQPAKYTGTYGTNGFYLNFTDIALTSGSNTGLGRDFSGNGNYWNTNNISVTSGVTYDAMSDVPTLTSATVANYCTLNPVDTLNWLSQNASMTLTNGNLTFACGAAGNMTEGTMAVSSGKWYFEITVASSFMFVGIRATRAIPTGDLTYRYYNASGAISVCAFNSTSPTNVATVATATTNGDIIGVAFDLDSNTISWYKNNTLLYTLTGVVPDTYAPGTGGAATATASINFGQRPFAYTPPTGFKALNTFNLPNSTIVKGNTVMDATLYTGNNTGQTITNAGSFRPDFLWIKVRSNTYDNTLADSVRGVSAFLASNTTAAEGTNSELTSFNSNGFTLGATGSMARNVSGQNYVAWQWQAGQGTTSSNTAGSITSTVSVNATAGFSIVTYTGSGAAGTVGHGLGVAPAMIITKNRTTGGNSWVTWHKSLTNAYSSTTGFIYLDQTAAGGTTTNFYDGTAMTSSTFRWQTGNININSTSNNYVSYVWAEIAGFSRFGSYTGNGSTDGPFIYTGFRPKYVMIKVSSTTEDWYIWDTLRGTFNANTPILYADLSAAESSSAIDTLSNGFKCRTAQTLQNANGATYIYMAFAENPFKNSLAR